MNNVDINAVKEFRRFINTYIYPETAGIIIEKIIDKCNTDSIYYESKPQALIKFHSTISMYTDNLSSYTHLIHDILKYVFIEHFQDSAVSSLVKSRIHTDIQDEDLKNLLRLVLSEIQSGNPCYLSLLFNITILNDNITYLYL